MVTTFYPPHHSGGDAVAVQRLVHALSRRGHDVTVIHDVDAHRAVHGDVERPGRPDPDGVQVHSLTSRHGFLSAALTQQTGRPVVHGRRIRSLLTEGRFDVVHFHNVSLVGGPGVLSLAPESSLRLYTAHEHWLVCPSHVLWRHDREPCTGRECLRCVFAYRRLPQLWRYTGAVRRAARHVDAFLAMSEFSRAKHAEFGFERDLTVIPGFTDLPATVPPRKGDGDAPPCFLFAGRLVRMKGLDDVIPVFVERARSVLLIAGDGPHRAELERLAGGSPHVRFLGSVDREGLDDLYAGATATLIPSIGFETFGLVTIEALAVGCPVIARRAGPLPEIVDASEAGELFDDATDLAAVLTRFENDPTRAAELGARGREAVRALWTEDVVLPQYLRVARDAARTRGLGRIADALERALADDGPSAHTDRTPT